MNTLFVTRHPGAVEWARRRGLKVTALEHLEPTNVGRGDVIIGTLPVSIIARVNARGARYLHLTIDTPPHDRGRELTADEMEAFGARLAEYRAWKVERDEPHY
ncbi:MAG: CRISPR-associated protein Csx16 [Hyphomicrobiales bacterium]